MVTKIEQQVMAGVGVIYLARRLTSRIALEIYALVISMASVVFFVSLPHVFANFLQVTSGGAPRILAFVLSAVFDTRLVVQIALLVGAFALISLTINLIRSLGTSRNFTPQH